MLKSKYIFVKNTLGKKLKKERNKKERKKKKKIYNASCFVYISRKVN